MATTLASVNVRIGARIEELQKGLKKAERELLRSGRQMSRIGGDLTRSLTLPLAGAGGASLKFASDFESSFLKINTLVGISGGVLDQFKEGIQNLSGPLGQSQQQLSDALFVITSAGQRGADALDTLEAASKASAIGLGKTTDIARAAVAAQQAYGKEVLTSTAAVDKFTAIVRAGNLEAAELAPTLGKVLPLASQLGVSFDEVGANIATFTRLGVPAAESVTALRSLLSNLIKPSAQASKELEKLGISANDLRDSVANNGLAATLQQLITAYDGNVEGLSRLFGNVEGLANALGTAGKQGESYLQIVDEISKSNGIVNEGFEKVSETAGFKLNQALVRLQNIGVQLGGTMIPVVTDLLDVITPLVEGFNDLDPSLKKIIVSTGLLAAAAGPTVSILGNTKVLVGQVGLAYKSLTGGLSIAAEAFLDTRAAIIAAGGNISALTGFTKAATVAWQSFNKVTKASIVGLTVAAVVALVDVVKKLGEETDVSNKITSNFAEIQLKAEENIVKERLAAEKLIGVINDETKSKKAKQEALEELNRISPRYFGGLSIEKDSIEQLNSSYDRYIESLLKSAKLKATEEKRIELAKEQLALEQRLNELRQGASTTFSEDFNLDFILSGERTVEQFLAKQINDIDDQIKSLAASEAELNKTGFLEALFNKSSNSLDGLLAKLNSLNDSAKNLNKNSQVSGSGGAQTTAAPSSFAGFGDSFAVNADAISKSSLALAELNNQINVYSETQAALQKVNNIATVNFYEQADAVRRLQRNMNVAAEAGNAIGQALFNANQTGKKSITDLLGTAANAARDFVKLKLVEAIAAQVAAAFKTGGVFGAALAPILAGGAAALFDSLVPKFATGGIVTSPTLALIGDNPNAATNPEYILRKDQLQTIANNLGGGVGGNGVIAQTYISGDDLRILLKRSERTAARRG